MKEINFQLILDIRDEISQVLDCMEDQEYIKSSFNLGGLDRYLSGILDDYEEAESKKISANLPLNI